MNTHNMFSWRNKKNKILSECLLLSGAMHIAKSMLNQMLKYCKASNLLSHLVVAGCNIGIQISICLDVCPSIYQQFT